MNVSHLYLVQHKRTMHANKQTKKNMLDNVHKCFGRFATEPNFIPIQYKSDAKQSHRPIAITITCAI